MKPKTYYYKDELNDDFSETNIKRKEIPADYKYISKNIFRRIWAFFIYYIIAIPVVSIIQKIKYHDKFVGKEKLKPYRKTGFFLYGNHTRVSGDAFCPCMLAFPKKSYTVVSPETVSVKGLGMLIQDLGATPVPTNMAGMKNFYSAIKTLTDKNKVITIYPEAHIWFLYTGIRPFIDTSFTCPVKFDKPSFAYTTTYQKRKHSDKVKVTVYIDGPFFPDKTLSPSEARKKLRNEIYDVLVERSKNSTYSFNTYVKVDENGNPVKE